MSIISKISVLAFASTLLVGCAEDAAPDADAPAPPATSATYLDSIGPADRPASLLVLAPTATAADRERLDAVLAQLGGATLAALPPRLVIAQVPPRAERALADLGVVARFDRAVEPADLAAPTLDEERFLAGAACHGCLLVSEPSCENRNDFLDRALVVPTVLGGGAEFFAEDEA